MLNQMSSKAMLVEVFLLDAIETSEIFFVIVVCLILLMSYIYLHRLIL